VTTPLSGRDTAEEELPDPRLFWKWVGKATRPVVGWILVGVGALFIVLGYVGVAHQVLVAKQLPYLVSGGILGLGVVTVGVMFIATEQIRRDSGRLDRLEHMVDELHLVLLSRPDAPALPAAESSAARDVSGPVGSPVNGSGAGHLVALAASERYHLDTCEVVQGKPASLVTERVIKRRALTPCPLCEPVAL
jgi:hypothetical protein